MNANDRNFGSRFFGRCASVYALCAVLASPALGQAPGNPGNDDDPQDVQVSDYGTVDISVQDTDLATVLQMLSIESKKNIITSKGVSATVTANLYDVTFHEALKAILDVNGFTYYEEGNFIYVITKEEAAAMEKARRKTESRIFELEHLSAADANEFILPLLSADGKASARGEVQPGFKPDVTTGGEDSYAFTPRVVVNDYPENLDAIAALLGELDSPPSQVLVEATILQTALDEANAFGVDFSLIGNVNFTDLTDPLAAVGNLQAGNDPRIGFQPADNKAEAVTTSVGATTNPAGLKIGLVHDDISIFLRVLDEVTDSTVLARPKVMALNRQRAEVLVGARVGYLSTTSTETTTTQSVQFLDTGIQLVFRPFISKDGMIRMELKPSVSEASLRSVTDASGGIVTIPDELTNQVTTNVRIQDGQTLVLGGLFKDATRINRRQVPLLGDIPVVGMAFRGQDDSVERTEVIFLITPSIVHDQKLWSIGREQMAWTDALRVGARAGLLDFSEEKVTGNYNQRAQDAFNAGDNDKALHYINKSLNVRPNQPEMVKLREQITGERAKAHERSMMERVFQKHMSSTAGPAAPPAARRNPSTSSGAQSSLRAEPDSAQAENQTRQSHSDDESTVDSGSMTRTGTRPGYSSRESQETSATDLWDSISSEGTSTPGDQQPVSHDSASSASDPARSLSDASSTDWDQLTSQEQSYYTQVLFEFFTAMGMPEMASNYACPEPTADGEVPFVTFDQMTEVAGVSDSDEPNR